MKNNKIQRMVGIAILSAIVLILQLLGQFIKLGPVSISLVLIPIVVGAAMYGPKAGAILGGVFALVVISQPDTLFFHSITVFGTVVVCLAKGILAGWLAGLTYQGLSHVNQWLAVAAAAVVCPLVNTGIFSLGCRIFFWDALMELGGGDALRYLLTMMIGFNFIAEFLTNVICAPIILRILRAAKRH